MDSLQDDIPPHRIREDAIRTGVWVEENTGCAKVASLLSVERQS